MRSEDRTNKPPFPLPIPFPERLTPSFLTAASSQGPHRLLCGAQLPPRPWGGWNSGCCVRQPPPLLSEASQRLIPKGVETRKRSLPSSPGSGRLFCSVARAKQRTWPRKADSTLGAGALRLTPPPRAAAALPSCSRAQLWDVEPWNRLGWERPLRSSSPTVNAALPGPSAPHLCLFSTSSTFQYHFQGSLARASHPFQGRNFS